QSKPSMLNFHTVSTTLLTQGHAVFTSQVKALFPAVIVHSQAVIIPSFAGPTSQGIAVSLTQVNSALPALTDHVHTVSSAPVSQGATSSSQSHASPALFIVQVHALD